MRVLFLCQYYWPEEQHYFVHELASGLARLGHEVTAFTAFPHYGQEGIFEGYRGRLWQTEMLDGVTVKRSWLHASSGHGLAHRLLNFGSFCLTSLASGLLTGGRPDVVYTMTPPLPIGVTGAMLAAAKKCPLVLHVQDIFPRAAVEHGVLTDARAIRFFERMEKWVYGRAAKLIAIADGFHGHFQSEGVPEADIATVENWADPALFSAGPKDNGYRRQWDPGKSFLVVYSGGINNNAHLMPLLETADALREEPFQFVIVGGGQFKPKLQEFAAQKGLTKVRFEPFQPWANYPDVLRAADMNVVSLSAKGACVSVPSKVYKQLAVGRAVLALTPEDNEVHRLVTESGSGVCVDPDDVSGVVDALRWARTHPDEVDRMGDNARKYLVEHNSLELSVRRIEEVLRAAVERGAEANTVAGGASN